MEARTKEEKMLEKMNMDIPCITKKQRKEMINTDKYRVLFLNKKSAWCSECGGSVRPSMVNEKSAYYICPHCNKRIKIERGSMGLEHKGFFYFQVITTIKDWQLIRTFAVYITMKKLQTKRYEIVEVIRNFVNEKGRSYDFAKTRVQAYYVDKFVQDSDMTLKANPYSYSISPYAISKEREFLPVLSRNGYSGPYEEVPTVTAIKKFLSDPNIEYLAKTRQKHLLLYHLKYSYPVKRKRIIDICNRNRYIVHDAGLWYDMIDTLERLGKDIHNAKYVCPGNLKDAHGYWMKVARKEDEKRKMKERIEEMMRYEEIYKAEKGMFFDLVFNDGNIVIETLKSVDEIRQEGEAMHHCVFINEYYKKKNSLIMSARDFDGNRIETIEIDLKEFKIVQSRGICNSKTDRHSDIIELINANMCRIMEKSRCA